LTKALAVDPTDVDALWDRSFLFKQIELYKHAVDGFTKILEYMPHHFKVINELAQLYRTEGRTEEAIKMYEEAIAYHTDNGDEEVDDDEDKEDEDGDFNDKLGYSEINMLSELYLILNDYRKSLNTIKTGLRFVQKRQNETWWVDRQDDDDEYLEGDEAKTDFPIELRVRMGICRVYLNQARIATVSCL
jgi:tetratricopeptide (TPR) repeat protein